MTPAKKSTKPARRTGGPYQRRAPLHKGAFSGL
jgi:hypothetical protein